METNYSRICNPLSLKSLTMEVILKMELPDIQNSNLPSTLLKDLLMLASNDSEGNYSLFFFSTSCYWLSSGKPLHLADGLPKFPKKIKVSKPSPGLWMLTDLNAAAGSNITWNFFSLGRLLDLTGWYTGKEVCWVAGSSIKKEQLFSVHQQKQEFEEERQLNFRADGILVYKESYKRDDFVINLNVSFIKD